MRAAVLCYADGRGGPGVPAEPASRCCDGENKHSTAGLFTQGVNLNRILLFLVLPLSPYRSSSFMLFDSLSHVLTPAF